MDMSMYQLGIGDYCCRVFEILMNQATFNRSTLD